MLPKPQRPASFRHHLLWLKLLVAQLRTQRLYRRKQREVLTSLETSPSGPVITAVGIKLGIENMAPFMASVLSSGEYEIPELALCEKLLTPRDRVVEIGSAIGFIGLFCQKNLRISEYLSVEPHPVTAAMLEKNYVLNAVPLKLARYALTAQSGTINLTSETEFWRNRIDENATASVNGIACEGRSLADLMATVPFKPTALIVDIEGAEYSVNWLALPSSIKTVVLELHPDGSNRPFELLTLFHTLGFYCTSHAGCTVGLVRR